MLFVIGIIIGMIVGFIYGFKDWGDILEGMLGALIGLLLGLILTAIIAGISLCFTPAQTETETQEIVALADNPRYEHYKRGYLICSGGEQLKYTYMYETDKGLTVKEVKMNNSYFNSLPEGEQPYVIVTTTYRKNIFVGKVVMECVYTFYLPPDSIVTGYQIDLQ
jgi:hypothetical protein